jgi:hypothetical protein
MKQTPLMSRSLISASKLVSKAEFRPVASLQSAANIYQKKNSQFTLRIFNFWKRKTPSAQTFFIIVPTVSRACQLIFLSATKLPWKEKKIVAKPMRKFRLWCNILYFSIKEVKTYGIKFKKALIFYCDSSRALQLTYPFYCKPLLLPKEITAKGKYG